MGMSASQARLLSITSRIHDLEYQAQAIDNSKLSLGDSANVAYDEYCDGLNASKYQLRVVTGTEKTKVDVTYDALIASGSMPGHSMYILTDSKTGDLYLPDAVVKGINGRIPEDLESFLDVVANNYVYSGEGMNNTQAVNKLKADGHDSYWTSVYYQLTGYTDSEGGVHSGHGFVPVSNSVANDREWIKNELDNGNIMLNIMETAQNNANGVKVNIFTETNVSIDTNLSTATDELRVSRVAHDYENKLRAIDQKEKQLDTQLSRIENERNALKTEYDTVKDLVKKNIERNYKTFNA